MGRRTRSDLVDDAHRCKEQQNDDRHVTIDLYQAINFRLLCKTYVRTVLKMLLRVISANSVIGVTQKLSVALLVTSMNVWLAQNEPPTSERSDELK